MILGTKIYRAKTWTIGPFLLLIVLGTSSPLRADSELVIRFGKKTQTLAIEIETKQGSLFKRQTELLGDWKPSADGSDPLDRLLPDGELVRLEVVPPSPYSAPLTRALFRCLDANGDGKLSREELQKAPEILLKKFDVDGDGCLIPLEIVPDLTTQAAPSGNLEPLEAKLQKAASGRKTAVRSPIRLNLDRPNRSREMVDGILFDWEVAPATATDLPEPPRALAKAGREKDRARFETIAREVVTLTLRPEVRGWFEILDANGDGQISLRELRQRATWEYLHASSISGNGETDFIELPAPSILAMNGTLTRGTAVWPAVRLNKIAPNSLKTVGPAWFQAMDRNRDGDLDHQEFLGTADQFQKLDQDGDGLISVDEALKASPENQSTQPKEKS